MPEKQLSWVVAVVFRRQIKMMNALRTITFLFSLVVLSTVTVFAQSRSAAPLSKIEQAFSKGDVDAIAALSADRVEIAVLGTSRLYSRTQAKFVLKEFFGKYPPVRAKFSEPSTTDKGLFAAGTYRHTANNKSLRLYVTLRKDASSWAVREIHVDKAAR